MGKKIRQLVPRLALSLSVLFTVLCPLMAAASLDGVINELLNKADQDLAADRLTTPVHNNAYDRYRAVLLLDQGNQRASLGIRAIAERYVAISRIHLKRGQFSQARRRLQQAIDVNGKNAQTA